MFTIDSENAITAHAGPEQAQAVENAECFQDEAGLAELAANWSAARLIAIWNSLPGVTAVKKFTNRQTAVDRIWKAIQGLDGGAETARESEPEAVQAEANAEPIEAPVEAEIAQPEAAAEAPTSAQPAQHVAMVEGDPTPNATHAKRARSRATDTEASAEPKAPRQPNKTEIVLALLKRDGGVTAQELMDATGWQAHSVRGFLSGTIGKKMGLALVSVKEGEKRAYSLPA